jgi:hypothetical protein
MNKETIEMRQKLFTDYCNHRDRIKKLSDAKHFQLDKPQEKKVLNLARKSFRQRENVATSNWLISLFRETNQYFLHIQMKYWPSMRGRNAKA